MANRPPLESFFSDTKSTATNDSRPALDDILSGKIELKKEPEAQRQSFIGWATSPLVPKESVLKSTIGQVMAGSVPVVQVGGALIPQPFSGVIPPNIRKGMGAELISNETSPLALASNFLAIKGMQASKVVPNLIKFGGEKAAQEIAEAADRGFKSVGKAMSNKYENLFNNIKEGAVSNSSLFEKMRSVVDSYPEAAGVPKLKSIMSRLADQDNISAKELHALKQVVRKSIPQSVWNGSAEADAIQNSMRDVYFEITDTLGKIGGKEYESLSKEFRSVKESERLAKKMFYKSGVPSNEALSNKMDVPTKRALKTLNDALPSDEKFLNQFNAWKRGESVKKGLKHAANAALFGGAIGGIGGFIGSKIYNRRSQ